MTLHCACDAESADAQEMSCALFDGHVRLPTNALKLTDLYHDP